MVLGIPSIGSDQDGAYAFLNYMLTPEAQNIALDSMAAIPVIDFGLLDQELTKTIEDLKIEEFRIGSLGKDVYKRQVQTLMIMVLGLFAFVFDTVGGVLFAKFLNLFSKNKINPMIGAAGISAFPMSARVIEKMGVAEDSTNHLLMHAIGANVSGQVASAVAGGIVLGFFM